MSREDIVKKTSPSDEFIHTAYVKFEGSTKEYAYLMSESQLELYRRGECRIEVVVNGQRTVVGLSDYKTNYRDPLATKQIDCIIGKGATLKTEEVKKGFIAGKHYKCIEQNADALRVNKLTFGKYYQCFRTEPSFIGICNDQGEENFVLNSRFDRTGIDSPYKPPWYNGEQQLYCGVVRNTIDDWINCNKYTEACQGVWITDSKQNEVKLNINQQEEVKMSNKQVQLVNIKLFDDDQGLKPADRIVAFHPNFATTSDLIGTTMCNALLKLDIAGDIEEHNKKRAATIDQTVLRNTGNKVFLQPIEFDDLRQEVTKV